jgi:hypothetical protein
MAGKVYVFNFTGEDLSLSVNGMMAPCGRIAGWSAGYRPNSGAVPRTLNMGDGDGAFSNGANQLTLVGMGRSSTAQIGIDGNSLPLNQDLVLLVQGNQWQLVSQSGENVASGPVTGW